MTKLDSTFTLHRRTDLRLMAFEYHLQLVPPTPTQNRHLFLTSNHHMTTHYSCPHLSTCSKATYSKKPCDRHCCLSIDRVKEHTLNHKIHGNCHAECPVYEINARSLKKFSFQPYTTPLNGPIRLTEETQAIETIFEPSCTTNEQVDGKQESLSSDKPQSRKLVNNRAVLRVIAYGLLVGSWSQTYASLQHHNRYVCDLACAHFRFISEPLKHSA
ncbi:hypothetical protein H4Q26_000248 [Puccinia striiformis f. sp. tritici PST-130]|uniref:Uncharacterized protein n=1 Tax=Puccinia striiformis f. sp. tritici PST-78 TaxID=1165861 RepID=A0A0L0VYP8_9BASI|nr:hypothetical protein H4Q26_000248 [Puccinia striiformis f. sp. tritici PST-130]KNF04388.1 hypothetical protein PSTG_02304 [Puccinia striiformis f. sp. tritici PST-78]